MSRSNNNSPSSGYDLTTRGPVCSEQAIAKLSRILI